LYGKRESKYDFLDNHSLKTISFVKLPNVAPNYFMVQKNFEQQKEYEKGFAINEVFTINGVGITTAHDEFIIDDNKERLLAKFYEFQKSVRDKEILHKKFNVNKKKDWDILQGYDNIKQKKDLSYFIKPIS